MVTYAGSVFNNQNCSHVSQNALLIILKYHFCRPDDWVMFDAMHKVPLPTLPTLKWDFGENSSEMPRPIIFNRN